MKKQHLLVFICLLAIVSCKKKFITNEADYSEVDTIRYDYTDENIIPRDSVFGEITFLPLETCDNNLIGMVDQVLFGDSTIIVVDRYVANGVFLFDFNGKYVGRMSRLGNGRNEFRSLGYVSKRPDGLFAVFDGISNNIMFFNERGKHVETIESDLYASAMEFLDCDNMAFDIYNRYPDFYEPYGNMSYVVKRSDMKCRYLFGRTDLDEHFNYSRYYNLYSFGGKVYCNVNFEDVIYELKADEVKARYRILFGPGNVNNHPYRKKEELYELQKRYPFFEGEFIELEDYTYIMFRGEEGRELIYDHSGKQTYAMSSGFNNPMIAFFRRPIARFEDNTMVCALSVSEAYMCRSALASISPKNMEINNYFSNTTIDSNPILFFFNVKL